MTRGAETGRRRCGGRRSSGAWIRSSIGGVLESEGVIEGGDLGGDGGLLMPLHLWWSRWCFLLNLLWHLEGMDKGGSDLETKTGLLE